MFSLLGRGICWISEFLCTGLKGDGEETKADAISRDDREWYNPTFSTIRGLLVLAMYLGSRGFEYVVLQTPPLSCARSDFVSFFSPHSGPCFLFNGLAMRLVEDFGLHLDLSRLTTGRGHIAPSLPTELAIARRDCFFSAMSCDM